MSIGLERFIEKINRLESDMISVEDLSKLTGIRKIFFYNLKDSDNPIPFIKIGKRIRFFKVDVIKWLKSCSNNNGEKK